MWSRNRQQGFSLIEMCIVIAIAAIISAIAIPVGLGMRDRYRLRASATDVLSAVKRAQTEAVRRGARIAILFAMGTPPAGGTCTVFVDNGAGGGGANDLIPNGTETVILPVGSCNIGDPGCLLPPPLTMVQTGNSLVATTPPPGVPPPTLNNAEFNSGGIPVVINAAIPATPVAIDVTGAAGLNVRYRIQLEITGHAVLRVSTNGGAFL